MLVAGDLDGFIGPRNPPCYDAGNPDIVRLFSDLVGTATDYYKRSGIFPIMHLLGVRKTLAKAHPWLPGALYKAFNLSKNMAVNMLLDTAASHATIPFLAEHIESAQALLGQDYWSNGVEANRKVLDNFLDHHHRQGLSARRVSVDELFHQGTIEQFSV
jgi:4,5-dihydroxyphthalate decarboxylase